jgi:hypothetical protein
MPLLGHMRAEENIFFPAFLVFHRLRMTTIGKCAAISLFMAFMSSTPPTETDS